jgi:3-hydroxybutyryl-CoA dehydrogenase
MRESKAGEAIAIIGAGTMAADIAARFAAHGLPVWIVARPGRSAQTVRERIELSAGQLADGAGALALRLVENVDALPWKELQLVIECVSEDLPAKRKIFAQMDSLAHAAVPLASNSSGFPISAIGEGLRSQARMLGLHFFMPAHLVPLVEVVCSSLTDPAIAEKAFELMASVGSVPVLVKRDIPGFLANRIQHALMREVWSLMDRGIASAEDIDKAVRYGFGMRYLAAGPVLQKEHSGLDVNLAASRAVYPDLCNASAPPGMLVEKVVRGEHGMKSGKGFWDWTSEAIAAEKARYARMLTKTLALLREESHGGA